MVSFSRTSEEARKDNTFKNAVIHVLNTTQDPLQLRELLNRIKTNYPDSNLYNVLKSFINAPSINKNNLNEAIRAEIGDINLNNITNRKELLDKYPLVEDVIVSGFGNLLPPLVRDIFSGNATPKDLPAAARSGNNSSPGDPSGAPKGAVETYQQSSPAAPSNPAIAPKSVKFDNPAISDLQSKRNDLLFRLDRHKEIIDAYSKEGQPQGLIDIHKNFLKEDQKRLSEIDTQIKTAIAQPSTGISETLQPSYLKSNIDKTKDIPDDLRSDVSGKTSKSIEEWRKAATADRPLVSPEDAKKVADVNAEKEHLDGADIAEGTDIREGFTAWLLPLLIEEARKPSNALNVNTPENSLQKLIYDKYVTFLRQQDKISPQEQELIDHYDTIISNQDIPKKSELISDEINKPISKEELSTLENNGFKDMMDRETNNMVRRHHEEREERMKQHKKEMGRFAPSWQGGARRVFEREFKEREDRISRDFERNLADLRANMSYKNNAETWGRAMAMRDLAARRAASQQNIENTNHQNTLSALRDKNMIHQGVDQRKHHKFAQANQIAQQQAARDQQSLNNINSETLRQEGSKFDRLGRAAQIASGSAGAPLINMPHIPPYQAPAPQRSGLTDMGAAAMGMHGMMQNHQDQIAQREYLAAQTRLANAQAGNTVNQSINPGIF